MLLKNFRSALFILTRKERITTIYLFFLMLIGMIFELLGVGVIIPAITFLTEGVSNNSSNNYLGLDSISSSLEGLSLLSGVLIIIFIYLIKSMFISYMIWMQTRFSFSVQAKLSDRIFSIYLQQPYNFHLQRNSSQIIRNIVNEVNQYTFTVMLPILTLLTEIIVLAGLLFFLLIIEPIGTLIIVISVGFSALIFYVSTRKKIKSWGERRQFHEGKRIQHIQQGLGSIKDVMLMHRQEYFLNQFEVHNLQTAKMGEFQKTLTQMPRIWLEFICISGALLLVIWLVSNGASNTEIIAILGFFAIAAFRMLPSVSRILAAIQAIRYGIPIIDILTKELKLEKKLENKLELKPLLFSKNISVKNISFTYPESNEKALENVSITIDKGQSIGIIGKSGSGKSTLIDLILGLLTPESGSISVDNFDINDNLSNWQSQIGYVPQNIYLSDDTLRRNIAFGIKDEFIDEDIIQKSLSDSQLLDFVDSLPHGLETIVGERGVRLSGGQIQRIGIARALYNEPSILVLDEATSSLDSENEKEVIKAIRGISGAKTFIIVTHRLNTVEHCDNIYKLKNGKIINHGPPKSILNI